MSRLYLLLFFLSGICVKISAQTATPPDKVVTSKGKKTEKQKVQTDKGEVKKAQTTQEGSRLKKDGTPDMRYKQNKESVKKTSASAVTSSSTTTPSESSKVKTVSQSQVVTPAQTPGVTQSKTTSTKITTNQNVKTADNVVGTDEKGRTIYEGSRGGKYYINKNGNKEYLKK